MLNNDILNVTTDIVLGFVQRGDVSADEVPGLIRSVYSTLSDLTSAPIPTNRADPIPAVSIKKSITPDFIICLEDGKKLKMLKRHLMTHYNMTPDDYRAKWGLPRDYPMVAPNYALQRRDLALQIGLGRKSDEAAKPSRRKRAA